MPTYEFQCTSDECDVDLFEEIFSFADMPQQTSCVCGADAPKVMSLFGSISSSDDPSFGSRKGEYRHREFSGFDPNSKSAAKNEGVSGWADRPVAAKSSTWESA